jgi:hypothetical protein
MVNGLTITPLALAEGAMRPIIRIAASVTATFERRESERARRIGGNLLVLVL